MVLKVIDATEAKVGVCIMVEGEPCIVRSADISKTGKHGHAKVRMEAPGVFDDKKRVLVVPGHERFEVPMIDKLKAQVLSVNDSTASLMDLVSFETFDAPIAVDIKGEIKEGDNVEYWNIEGRKIVKRKS